MDKKSKKIKSVSRMTPKEREQKEMESKLEIERLKKEMHEKELRQRYDNVINMMETGGPSALPEMAKKCRLDLAIFLATKYFKEFKDMERRGILNPATSKRYFNNVAKSLDYVADNCKCKSKESLGKVQIVKET